MKPAFNRKQEPVKAEPDLPESQRRFIPDPADQTRRNRSGRKRLIAMLVPALLVAAVPLAMVLSPSSLKFMQGATNATPPKALDIGARMQAAKAAPPPPVQPTLPALLPGTSLRVLEASQGWGQVHLNQSVEGHGLKIASKAYTTGIGTHAASHIKIAFEKSFSTFSGACGLDAEVGTKGTIVCKILADGRVLFTSKPLKGGMPAESFSVSVKGVKSLELQAQNGVAGIDFDHADWVNLETR